MSLLMKTGMLVGLAMSFECTAFSQDLAGFRTGNYTGVTGVFSNPANIAGSPYRWDVNLFSLNLLVGNDKASFSLKNMAQSLNGDTLKHRLAGEGGGPSSAMVSMNVLGPSFMFNIGKRNTIALSSRVRVMANTKKVDGKLLNQFLDQEVDDASLPYNFSTSGENMISLNAWSEFGASFGRVIYDEGVHRLRGGITLKYLAGVSNSYLQMSNLKGTLDADPNGVYLSQMTGTLGLGFGGTRLDDITDGKLKSFNGSGLGGDIGFVYELRPKPNGYLLRAGVSLMDIGSIRYTQDSARSGVYNAHVTGAQKAYIDDFGEVDNFNSFFRSHPQYFTPAGYGNSSKYSVGLPTTLHLDLDYHIFQGFYANVAGQISLAGSQPYKSTYYNSYTVTGRWEGPSFGFYLPINYNELTHFNTGVSFRLGPVFFGSGSVISALIKDSKQADFYFGVRFGGLRKG